MTESDSPEVFQSTIVISKARNDELAAALSGATEVMEKTATTNWEPYTETPAQQRANARAQRIAWFVESL